MSRCRACDVVIEREIYDSKTKTYSDLCKGCYFVGELVLHGTFVERKDYAHDDNPVYTKINNAEG